MTMHFGETLESARECRKLSQSRLAKLAGLDPSSISRMESGQRNPSREMVMRLAAALNLPSGGSGAEELLRAAGFTADGESDAIYPEYRVVTRLHETLNNPILAETDRALIIDAVDAILGLSFLRPIQATVMRVEPRTKERL